MVGKKADYIVYDKETDLPVCLGTIDECAKYLGFTVLTLRSIVSKTKSGQTSKYEAYNIDELLKDYDEEKVFGKIVDKEG